MGDYPWRNEDKLRELYVDKQLSTTEIADRWGSGNSTIQKWLDRHGIEARDPSKANSIRKRKKSKGAREEVRKLYNNGSEPADIADQVGKPVTTVRSWIDQMGIKRTPVECPTCGKGFANENGMKVHHAKAHDESISGVEIVCSYCGEKSRVNRSRAESDGPVFCNKECKSKWMSENQTGEPHPNYNRATVSCEVCDTDISRPPCEIESSERHFCSDDCLGTWLSENFSGEDSPHWEGGAVETECAFCGDVTTQSRSNSRRTERAFCDRDCFLNWHAENMRGENSPRWEGGHDGYYGPNWQQQREMARERDDYTCQICGAEESDLHRSLDVHHLTPVREFRDDSGQIDFERAHSLENLISLCPSCHRQAEKTTPLIPEVAD